MTRRTRAGLYNGIFGSLAAAAAAFATYWVPEQMIAADIEQAGLPGVPLLALRIAMMFGAAAGAFLLCWLPLRACDSLARRQAAVAKPPMAYREPDQPSAESAPEPAADPIIEQPQATAAPIDEHVELRPSDRPPLKVVISGDGHSARAPSEPPSSETLAGLVQRIDAAFSQSEWPISQDPAQQQLDEAEDQLRDVLRNLKTRIRQGER